jgi:dynein heavy chain
VEKRTKGVYVPLGGKKLLTLMDDFNMPAKDTFGSQPPLELIKLWLDYGFWYDRTKQTVKYIKVSSFCPYAFRDAPIHHYLYLF